MLLPGNISTCGELASPGTYTLTQNISGGDNTCLNIGSDNIIINGGGFTISGTGTTSPAIDARVRTGGPSSPLTEGANAYTNLVINDINISGYTIGLNISGNDDLTGNGVNNGFAGDSGDTAIYYSYIGSISANGGQAGTKTYGGLGGNISFTDTNLNISSSTISAVGGLGTVSRNTYGGLDLNHIGTLNSSNLTLSQLSYLDDNTTAYGAYPGGTWPMLPGNISSCGTLYATTSSVFTLTQNVTSSGTCFTVFGNNITLNGGGYSVTAATTTTEFAITARELGYDNLTIKDLDIVGFVNSIDSAQSLILEGTELNTSLDISDETINADDLIVKSIGVFIYASTTISQLSSLIVNNFQYGFFDGGLLEQAENYVWKPQDLSRNWQSVTSSSDGTKLAAVVYGGQIYTSTNGGLTWVARESNRNWQSVTSSADGTKLAAVVNGGQIYTSTDSGATWTIRGVSANWQSITSSADGTKLAAVVYDGQIYTSIDGGITWIQKTFDITRNWQSVTSSTDGTKLAAVAYGGKVYTSTDSGATWTQVIATNRNWQSVTSSSDGTKLAAVVYGGQIYTSTDSGAIWTAIESNRNWYSITSSADGTKLAAVVQNGQIYTSTDSGLTWTARDSGRDWRSITSSADGNKLVATVYSGYIYNSSILFVDSNISISTPTSSSTISTWNPSVLWGSAVICEYSYDNNIWTTADCSTGGSDIVEPQSFGTKTLWIRGYGNGNTYLASSTFEYVDNIINIISPSVGLYQNIDWNPNIDYDITNSKTLTACYYSYDNFVSTSTINCNLNGSDIILPNTDGQKTLSIKVIDNTNTVYANSAEFDYIFTWTARDSSRNWRSITSSADGTKLAAVVYGGQIYTSTTSGATWTARDSSRNWQSITSSSDGTKLAAVVYGGYIYTSIDGGITWIEKNFFGNTDNWQYITSSADGTKLVAGVDLGNIYTSIDSGDTWTLVSLHKSWRSITSSADGTKLAAAPYNSFIYTSTTSGATWTPRNSTRKWISVTSSSDGTKLAAVEQNGQIYTSTDSGTTWTARDSVRNWLSITSSSDGTKLAAVEYSGYIYTSIDSGITWRQKTSDEAKNWRSITSSADGTKLAAIVENGQIYTLDLSAADQIQISISNPVLNSVVYSDSNIVIDWSIATSCYYSYDNFTSTSTADCSLNGSDISKPLSDGSYTLYIRASFGGSIGNSSVTFTYDSESVAYTWLQKGTLKQWTSITSSADGNKLAAVVQNGQIYTSTDAGVTWTARESNRNWRSITSSYDGTKLAAIEYGGQIYTSSNSGITWTARDSSRNWRSITSSADGTKLAAVVYGGQIYTSTNSGVTWTPYPSLIRNWQSITSSSDGTKLAVVSYSGRIYTSTNSGGNWTQRTFDFLRDWQSITSSADGTKLAAVVLGGQIYMSTTSGVTWTARESNRNWQSITSSADGTKLAAVVQNGQIYTSINGGVTWTPTESNRDWRSITSSVDGNKLAATAYNGYIYNTSIPPTGLTIDILSPISSSTISTSNPVVLWGSSITCEYSYDNSIWITVDCSRYGNDIPFPNTGPEKTLYIRGTDSQSNIDTDESTFTLEQLYFCGTANSDWSNDENWYYDELCYNMAFTLPGKYTPAFVLGTVSPIFDLSSPYLRMPNNIDTTGMTGPALSAGVIFASSTLFQFYEGNITGNVTFNDSSYNKGNITGNAILNTDYYSGVMQTGSDLIISSGSSWFGEVSGNVYNSDNTIINNWIFTGTGSNQGVVNGNATFSGTSFYIGGVNGTTTLNGLSQVLQGAGNTINLNNLIKQSPSRDVLYLESDLTINTSGLLNLTGLDQNNLLTIRSTVPGSAANLGINGTTNINFVRLKDIHNTGAVLDLSSKIVFDDGGNTGFIFPSNSTPASRGGVTGSYTVPSLPPSRIVAPAITTPTVQNNNTTNRVTPGGTLDRFINPNLRPLYFNPLQNFDLFNKDTKIGSTIIPNPLQGFKASTTLNLVKLPINFLSNAARFISDHASINDSTKYPDNIVEYLRLNNIDVTKERDLVKLVVKPIFVNIKNNNLYSDMFEVMSKGNIVNTKISYDHKLKSLVQIISMPTNTYISLNSDNVESIIYMNKNFTMSGNIDVLTPGNAGRYIIQSSNIPFVIDVFEPKVEVKSRSFWSWFKGLFK